IDVRGRWANRIGVDLAVRLTGNIKECFGLTIELLQVQSDRAVKREKIRTYGLTGCVGDAYARQAKNVFKGLVEHQASERIEQPSRQRHGLSGENRLAVSPRDDETIIEKQPLYTRDAVHAD